VKLNFGLMFAVVPLVAPAPVPDDVGVEGVEMRGEEVCGGVRGRDIEFERESAGDLLLTLSLFMLDPETERSFHVLCSRSNFSSTAFSRAAASTGLDRYKPVSAYVYHRSNRLKYFAAPKGLDRALDQLGLEADFGEDRGDVC
jgi:hypothetical protein